MEMFNKKIDVLLVEDDEGHSLLIQEFLRENEMIHHVYSVMDGQAALDYLFHENKYADPEKSPMPDLVLLDINLPLVNGFDVLKKIKNSDNLKNIPVIILSSAESQSEVNKGYQLGANNYVTKPVDFELFKKKVKYLCQFLEIIRFPEIVE